MPITDLKIACLEFWIAMFNYPLKDNDYENAVLSRLAVLGVDSEYGG